MKRTKEYSIKSRIVMILMGCLIPIIMFLILFNVFMIGEMNEKLVELNENILYVQCQNLERNMASIETAMVNLTTEQPYFQSLAYGPAGEYENYVNEYDTCKGVSDMMYPYREWYGSVVISVPKNVYRILDNTAYGTKISQTTLLDKLRGMAQENELPSGNMWHALRNGDESYLIRVMGYGYKQTYLIGIIDLNELVLIQNKELDSKEFTVYYDEDAIYTNEQMLTEAKLSIGDGEDFVEIDGKRYLVTESYLEKSRMRVAYLTPAVTLFKVLSKGHILFLVISALIILVIPIAYELVKRLFFRPLDRLVDCMEQIRDEENQGYLIPEGAGSEFTKVYQTLDNMIAQIRKLKIESYEKELQVNKTQLEYYQIQIRPHFYLNCLKNIYGMLELRQYEDVQKSVVLLSKHLRYMLREVRGMVEVAEELRYIENYIELQNIGREKKIESTINCEQELKNFLIPGISLLSFVENSVKYSQPESGTLKIGVTIETLHTEEEKLIHMRITDNGQGYEEGILKCLNFKDGRIDGSTHLGINNVVRRFRLQYGENVMLAFGNYEGAETEIFIRIE